MVKRKFTKRFNGKAYEFLGTSTDSRRMYSVARQLRQLGNKARVESRKVKGRKIYTLWVRTKPIPGLV